ncbi:uncharacterized protein J4E92_000231 [Alternaria infectoria]|uniref:uncharacterized protein n=1 Tax=Alternaria infectoria TaxID=45303 RepID=UPI00221ECB25|nr:uncharacterized protein J4E92_000231 [Alternaria infectoria]KAI4938950.1 hypothetical protein J4E92_000231 [Alternaria infectoria]
MKLLSYGCLISLVTSATSGVVSGQELHEDFTAINSSSKVSIAAADPQLAVDTPPPPDHDSIWHKAYCRGAALVRAMSLDEEESNTMLQWPYTQSPWDGDLKPELRKWGWLDNEEDNTNIDDSCDFDEKLKMKNTFDALGVDTRPAGKGGPNHCFRLQHSNGPTVIRDKNGKMPYLSSQRYEADGKTYRVTDAYSTVGINRNDGILYFLNRMSPEQGAADLWNLRPEQVDKADLPKIRSSSDLAWALWNRVPGEPMIKMIMALQIVNTQTAETIIPKALEAVGETELKRWPGTEIVVGSDNDAEAEAALALIGSPNGLGAGYFLLQHKRQLGGANFIYKITIFRNDGDEFDDEPNLIFHVDKNTTPMPDVEDTPGAPEKPAEKGSAAVREAPRVEKMKFTQIFCIVGLVALGATEALRNLTNVTSVTLESQNLTVHVAGDPDDSDDDDDDDDDSDDSDDSDTDDDDVRLDTPVPATEALWHASKCRGAKLMFACTQDPPQAARFVNPLTVPWDGDLRNELLTWGYNEGTSDPDDDCEIGVLQPMLDALGLSKENNLHGGPNYCFSYQHRDSAVVERPNGILPPKDKQWYTVDGVRYRVTDAYATVVINKAAGIIFFLRRGSAEHQARRLWKVKDHVPIPPNELPALRTSSDVAWGFWNRVSGENLANINGVVSMLVTNDQTRRIMDRMLVDKNLETVQLWPGTVVDVHSVHYLALLGSPNGRAVGYLLAQHKAKIGGNRYVESIHIFRPYEHSTLPHLFFRVGWAPSPPPTVPEEPIENLLPPEGNGFEVVRRGNGEKNIIREHVIRAKL